MADGDGVLLLVVALVAIAAAGSGASGTEPIRFPGSGTTTTTTGTTSGIPGGYLSTCPGWIVGQRTANGMTLRVFYDPQSGGLNCVSVTRNGVVTAPSYLRAELRFSSYSGSAWPQYSSRVGAAGAQVVSGAYLTAADNRCVTAVGTYYLSGGTARRVSLNRIACG
ncbi:MAG TPA: hypothetical protein VKB85_01455 [Propionibacteriaceae bacterium]|jgi:hypothetical protein|nr:hypothetical protein [Propionibacteriaceae bacterium]